MEGKEEEGDITNEEVGNGQGEGEEEKRGTTNKEEGRGRRC